MGGFFGVTSKEDCVQDLFYGTDYHCHLGTRRGGLAAWGPGGFTRFIHNIENAQFKSKFESDISGMEGNLGIGIISDYEDQPLIIGSHLGTYAIVTVGIVNNTADLVKRAFGRRATHFSEMSGEEINTTELVATLINQGSSFEDGIRIAQNEIQGSCSLLVLTAEGIYAARDRLGRTPVVIGRKNGSWAVTMESCALPNLGFAVDRILEPGEIDWLTCEGIQQKKSAGGGLQICSFLWIYYGYPASSYEGINVEDVRNRCGAFLAEDDDVTVDMVAAIPDSGTGHAIGYASRSGVPFRRPFVKYTPTWPRSFMPQDQNVRDLVAKMKLIPIAELIDGARILFCEDSIVRGTQLKDIIKRLFEHGAEEVHMRPACPPLLYKCPFLNFSRSRSELDLAARRAIEEIEGDADPAGYSVAGTPAYEEMVGSIERRLGLTSLRYQRLDRMVEAIGLPGERLCTYCWDGKS
jgi:amidophosphoribosyltransferase